MRFVPSLLLSCCLVLPGCMSQADVPGAAAPPADSAETEVEGEEADEAFVRHASSLVNQGNFEAAVKLARNRRAALTEDGPSSDLTLLIEADALRLAGKPAEAWDVFRTVLSPDSYPAPWTRTGMDILYDLGRRDEAYTFCADNISRIPQPHLRHGVRQMCVRRSLE